MTFPFRRSVATHTSTVNETFRAVMPATVVAGDLLVVDYAGDGTHTGFQVTTGDFQGWNLWASDTTGTLVGGSLYKIANGTEAGLTLLAGTSPSEKWCVNATAYGDVDLYLNGGGNQRQSGTGANPNPDVHATAAVDSVIVETLAGDGLAAITGVPSGYTTVANLNNAAADGAALGVAEKFAAVANEDAGAWTRASAAWVMNSVQWRGIPVAPDSVHPTVDNSSRKVEVLSGGTKNYTVTIPAGRGRRFFAVIHAASSAISAVVLDPAGLALTLSPVTDGTTTVETAAVGTARAATCYTLDSPKAIPTGTYTLRVTSSVTTDVACLSETVRGADQALTVHDVVTGSGTTSTSATGSIATPRYSLVLLVAVQPMTTQPSALTWATRTGFFNQSSAWVSPHYVTFFARRVPVGTNPLAITIAGAGAVAESFAAFTLKRLHRDNAPHSGSIN